MPQARARSRRIVGHGHRARAYTLGFGDRHEKKAFAGKAHDLGIEACGIGLHDGHARRDTTGTPLVLAVLPRLIEAIGARALRPVTLREALR